jgi:hypothetical protein
LKEEEEQDKVAALLRQQRLNATSNDRSDTSGFNAAFMALLNDHTAWAGYVDDDITLSICESDRLLIDLTRDEGKAGPSDTVKGSHPTIIVTPTSTFAEHNRHIERRNHC